MSKTEASTMCGLCGWRPACLQPLATKQVYVFLYSLLGVCQGMGFTYLSSVLSTIERQFGIKSEEAAWVFSGNEISQIFFIFVLPFMGRIRNRAKWMSIAMIVSAFGQLLCAFPYFLKDKSLYDGGWNIGGKKEDLCTDSSAAEDCVEGVKDWTGLVTIFVGFFITGIGTSFFYSFGVPYIDDNVEKQNSPAVLGVVLAARTTGPSLGYLLGSACLSMYVVPGTEGDLKEGDPGWLGAWWLGFVIVSISVGVVSPLLGLFPERLPVDNTDADKLESSPDKEEFTSARDYVRSTLKCFKRLSKNKCYVFNSISTTIFLFGFMGFGTFIPKFFEYHYRQKASGSGSSGGLVKTIGTAIGMVVSGFVISKYRFRARTLAAWNLFIGVVSVASFVAISQMRCPKLEVAPLDAPCNINCNCDMSNFRPTCGPDGSTLFLSACHAGCRSAYRTEGGKTTLYEDCSCTRGLNATGVEQWWAKEDGGQVLPSPVAPPAKPVAAVSGFCPNDCSAIFFGMLGFLMVMTVLSSTGRVGNSLISLRAVEAQDKAASLVIMVCILSLFAFLPSPIIYGAMLDNTCVIWGSQCGVRSNCLLYDTDMMRYYMCGFLSVCLFLAVLFDIGTWYYCKGLELYGDEEEKGKEETSIELSKKQEKK